MAVNKVMYGDQTVLDLTSVTAEESDVMQGYTFHKANGEQAIGIADVVTGASVEDRTLILYGHEYVPPSWSNGTDYQISQALQFHYDDLIDLKKHWSEGQEREIQMSDGTIVTYILKSTEYDLVTPIGDKTKSLFSIWPKYIVHNRAYGKYVSSRITWTKSQIRPWANGEYKDMFPELIQGTLKQFVSPLNANDYFFIPNTNQGIMTNPEGTPQRYWLGGAYPSSYPAEEYYVKTDGSRASMSCNNVLGVFLVGTI